MRYLLDTHAFLWLDAEPHKLPSQVATICADESNALLLSLVSVWEIQIKLQLGKLKLNSPLVDVVRENQVRNHLELLSITLDHILALATLPDHHRDPFDRLLIAQTNSENLVLISNDPQIAKYPVQYIW